MGTSSVPVPASTCSTWWTRCCKAATSFLYPLHQQRTPELSQPVLGQPPRFDLVIVLQYESLWLDWQGARSAPPAPHLNLPAGVAQWHRPSTPHHGGMTVLAGSR